MKPGLLAPAELGRLCLLVQKLAPGHIDESGAFVMPRLAGEVARAMDRIVRHNLGLVGRIAQRYSRVIEVEEGMQEGTLGMMRAVYAFDPTRGFAFTTYSSYWIRHYMLRAAANTRQLIRVPVHLRDRGMKARTAGARFIKEHGRPATDAELAKLIGVTVKKLVEALSVQSNVMISLDAPAYQHGDSPHTIADFVPDHALGADGILDRKESIEEARRLVRLLPDRERKVLEDRFFGDLTLKESGEGMGVSRERVRQLEERALELLRFASRFGRMPRNPQDPKRAITAENKLRAVPAPKVAKAPKPITPAKLRARAVVLRRLDEQVKPMRCSAVGRRDHGRCSFNALPGGEFCGMHAARVTARERTASTPAAARGKQNLW